MNRYRPVEATSRRLNTYGKRRTHVVATKFTALGDSPPAGTRSLNARAAPPDSDDDESNSEESDRPSPLKRVLKKRGTFATTAGSKKATRNPVEARARISSAKDLGNKENAGDSTVSEESVKLRDSKGSRLKRRPPRIGQESPTESVRSASTRSTRSGKGALEITRSPLKERARGVSIEGSSANGERSNRRASPPASRVAAAGSRLTEGQPPSPSDESEWESMPSEVFVSAPFAEAEETEDLEDAEEQVAPQLSRRSLRSSSPAATARVELAAPTNDLVDRLSVEHRDHTPPPASTSASPPRSTYNFPDALLPLLPVCRHPEPIDFSAFVQHPPLPFASSTNATWKKIGEASFSEVFTSEGADGEPIVVKIIPISAPQAACEKDGSKGQEDIELPYSSDLDSVLREIDMSRLVGDLHGFVAFRGAFIVQGPYPGLLLDEWDSYKTKQYPVSDAQIRPDVLPRDQVYAVICLAHGGSDLEEHKLRSWREAISILRQVAEICANAEKAVGFEHRDLHIGNILVKPKTALADSLAADLATMTLTPSKRATAKSKAVPAGVEVTLIDFTLSRGELGGQALFDPFSDEDLFRGHGLSCFDDCAENCDWARDYQFDVYRSMRAHVGTDWESFHPLTTVMWLNYLAHKLLNHKNLKVPSAVVPSAVAFPSSTALSSPRRGTAGRHASTFASTRRRAPLLSSGCSPAELRQERMAYETLLLAKERLGECVRPFEEDLEARGKSAGRQAKGKAKRKAREPVEVTVGGEFKSAGDFVTWWLAQDAAEL